MSIIELSLNRHCIIRNAEKVGVDFAKKVLEEGSILAQSLRGAKLSDTHPS